MYMSSEAPLAVPVATGIPVTATPVVATPVVATPVAIPPTRPPEAVDPFGPSKGTENWSQGLFACCSCSGKDQCTCNGCIQECCCCLCVFSSAVAKSGIDPLDTKMDERMRCLGTAGGLCCEVVPCQANILRVLVRLAVAKKYNIREEVGHAACVTLCCCCCADGQVQNEIMVREHLTYGCAEMVPEK